MYKFDLSSVKINSSQITSVKFAQFALGGTGSPNISSYAYRITKNWVATEATWMESKKGEKWDMADTATLPIYVSSGKFDWHYGGLFTKDGGSSAVPLSVKDTWEEYDVTTIVKAFLSGTPNYGFIIDNNDFGGHTETKYCSSKCGVDSLNPKLIINYSTAITNIPKNGILNNIQFKQTKKELSFFVNYTAYTVSINNTKGQRIMQNVNCTEKEHTVSLENLSRGVYFLSIRHNNKTETITFTVVK